MNCWWVLLTVVVIPVACREATPTVTLHHGGKLAGRRISFQDTPVDIFQGIRYAKPPTGDLRFKRPEKIPPWQGTVEAKSIGSQCPQIEKGVGPVIGNEDCLFLDVTVPGGVDPKAKKAVMVWIPGGGYMFGGGSPFLGTPLAVIGDVVFVTINYRLGILGFLANGPGTGNFGLWDQRAALLWVKENIERFGGDPDLVTIFGESAGAGSVSSHVMSQHSDGLFKRGIQQSGTLYQMLPTSVNRYCKLIKMIRQQLNCESQGEVYDCLRDMSPSDLLTNIQLPPWESFWHPFADGDFFGDDVLEYSYEKSQRFDMLLGMNAQEGGIMVALDTAIYAMIRNTTIQNGIDLAFAREYLTFACPYWFAPFSPSLCAEFVINNYGLAEAENDKDRFLRLRDFLSESFFDADIYNQLSQHSPGKRSTYAYYFSEPTTAANSLWRLPEWAKSMADHADELTFTFGGAFYKEIEDPTWQETVARDDFIESLIVGGAKEEYKPLSEAMITMWTNFAKSGNPNEPKKLPDNLPTWPQFTTETNHFLEMNSKQVQVVTTPNKDRLAKIKSHIFEARRLQFAADRPSAKDEIRWRKAADKLKDLTNQHDEL